ncbi:hypothetical protein [Streptomyces sp. NPDC002520]
MSHTLLASTDTASGLGTTPAPMIPGHAVIFAPGAEAEVRRTGAPPSERRRGTTRPESP